MIVIIFKCKFHRGHQETSVTPAFEPLSKCFRQKLNLHPRTFPCTVCTWTWTCPALSYFLTSGHYSMELKVLFRHRGLAAVSLANILLLNSISHASDHVEASLWWRNSQGLYHTRLISPFSHPSAMPIPGSIRLQSEHSGGLKNSVLFGCNCVAKTLSTAGGKTEAKIGHRRGSTEQHVRKWKTPHAFNASLPFSLFCYLSETGNTGMSCQTG